MSIARTEENSLLQKTYVQKSKLFLLPLTGIRKDKVFKPINTYVSSRDLISDSYPNGIKTTDYILIINYPKSYKEESEKLSEFIAKKTGIVDDREIESTWERFEIEYILSNPLLMAVHEVEDEFIYTFDLSDWKLDWDKFLQGRYSLLSQRAKDKVVQYRKHALRPSESRKLLCYLNPTSEGCLRDIARQLDIDISELRKVRELCDKPNFKLEDFVCQSCIEIKKEIHDS